ncbi:MAG: TIGR01212 family radical SAM protein [Gammaproteobacteria bacterium]|nr:TIGR01212 family radical SAM protein [Gammaproteobacteria bacterium]
MQLSDYVNTLGQHLLAKYGCRVHKLAIDANFTCPNRDGSKGIGGCTFCNNDSFSPNTKKPPSILMQMNAGKAVIRRRTGAERYLAYFQAYTNTYAEINALKTLYDEALADPEVIGLSIGTRPDCVPDPVLDLLTRYQDQGKEIWLELGLQSAFDKTLTRVNRGHGFAEYVDAVRRARHRNLQVCCHLIVGLPGENPECSLESHARVMEHGVDGFKIHPLHVVKNTLLAKQWRDGEYEPLALQDYIDTVSEIVIRSPRETVFHRLTGTAQTQLLLAPDWCQRKWLVLNSITQSLHQQFEDRQLPHEQTIGADLPGRQHARAANSG